VFTVDDGLFGLHLEWVEAVYPRSEARIHTLRGEARRTRGFLVHGGQPALVVDLREAFRLDTVLSVAEREHYLVARSGPLSLALPVDGCAGVRELELKTQVPLPAAVLRDGGLPAGHIVEVEDGRMLVVLDPARLVDESGREELLGLHRKAVAFQERQEKLDAVWQQVCAAPDVADLRAFARLCSRNGRSRAALATRLLIKHMSNGGSDENASESLPAHERLVRELVRLGRQRCSGSLMVDASDHSEPGRIMVSRGRVVDAFRGSEWGRPAFASLLSLKEAQLRFLEEQPSEATTRFSESTAALLIATFESLSGDRRRRRA
jgi:chemotaxis signal transduction protein